MPHVVQGASADSAEQVIDQGLLDTLGVDALNREVEAVGRDMAIELTPLTVDTIREIAGGGVSFDPARWSDAVRKMVFHEVFLQLHLLGKILLLSMLCVLMQQLQDSFRSSEVAVLAYSVCFIFLLTVAMKAFYAAVVLAGKTIDAMITIMESILPMMLLLLTTVGSAVSAALFTPLIFLGINVLGFFMKSVIMPLFLLVAVLDAVNCFSTSYRVGQLASLFRQGGMLLFALGMTLFTGLLTVQGVSGGIADGLGLRTAKFAVGNLIPIVGKLFADSVDVVFGASLILKNAIGVFGIVTIGAICLTPLIKLLTLSFLMKASGALIQPLGEVRLARCLSQMGSNVLLLFGAVMAVALLFFLTVTMIVGIGAMAIMMR